LTAEVDLPPERYPTPARQAAFITSAIEQLAALPGVVAASASSDVPGLGGGSSKARFAIVGDPDPDPSHTPVAVPLIASPSYFSTMGITLLRGRVAIPGQEWGWCDLADVHAQTLTFWPMGDPAMGAWVAEYRQDPARYHERSVVLILPSGYTAAPICQRAGRDPAMVLLEPIRRRVGAGGAVVRRQAPRPCRCVRSRVPGSDLTA
jgi:hypothetical protein